MPSALHEFAKAGLKDPEMVRLDTDTKISAELSTAFFTVRYEEKASPHAAVMLALRFDLTHTKSSCPR